MTRLSPGQIDVPSDWEMRTQVTYIEPAESMEVPLAVQQTQPKPRANVVVSRSRANANNPNEAMSEFVKQTAQAVAGLKTVHSGTLSFDDGAEASWVTISFNATPQTRLAQRHVFRIDGDILTQIVATVDEGYINDLTDSMQKIIASFKP